MIARFELAGWESVFPVLEQVLRNGAAASASAKPDGNGADESRPVTADEWSRRVIGTCPCSRGLATCIQSNYLNVQRDIRRYLGLSNEVAIVASVLIGHKAPDASLVSELFRTRKPVAVDWIETFPADARRKFGW